MSQIPKFQRYRQTRKKKYSILFTHVSCTQPWNKLPKENEHAQTFIPWRSVIIDRSLFSIYEAASTQRGTHISDWLSPHSLTPALSHTPAFLSLVSRDSVCILSLYFSPMSKKNRHSSFHAGLVARLHSFRAE